MDNEFKVDRWAEKVQTAYAVRKAINDYLVNTLPYPANAEDDISRKTDVLFNFFKGMYGTYHAASWLILHLKGIFFDNRERKLYFGFLF